MTNTFLLKIAIILITFNTSAQTSFVTNASGDWKSLIKLDNFDPNDDQQSNADTDFVGNATNAILETQNETISFNDGITDEVYYFRVRMGQSNPNTSFYLGLDISGDYIADIFIEANVKSQTPYVAFHLRDYSMSGLSPSQTSWLNGSKNNELELSDRDAVISDYSAGTDLDGGTSGTDFWIEFGFTEERIKDYVLANFGISIDGDSIIALYGFSSTSQTSNGDVIGVDDTIPGELDRSWVDLGVVINGTLNNITSGTIVRPTFDILTTEDSTPTLTGSWGSTMLGDDHMSITLNGNVYTIENGLLIDTLNWSLPIEDILSTGIYNVIATVSRDSNGQTVSDSTSNELTIQGIPFNCDYNAYLFQFNDVYAIDLASGNSYPVATDITEGSINATAYNPMDGFIWGSLNTPSKTIVRIGKNFETTTFYVDELPTNGRYIGDVSATGIYYLKGGGTEYYTIDLNPSSEHYGQHIATKNLSQSCHIHDWAFNAIDNKLYSVEKSTNILYRIDADTGVLQSLGEVPILSGLNYTYGAVYFDASGRFYISSNQTGTIYVIQNVQDLNGSTSMDSNLFAFGPSSSSNDGARCPTAPVPQEDCINGIDDDGDGLIDCEDPSCSGYASCPVIQPPTSSGNSGGLESNNRLSQQISKRNFSRAKTSYGFDKATANKLVKSNSYARTATNATNEIELENFIPLEIINEERAIESSPRDLIGITNASDVYSVDYLRAGKTVSSILVLKTEDGVYEHTKYICDRLLGAQLISVSTLEIRDQRFIKSLIRNTDGSLEFVLSLSAKITNDDKNFAIESHWNLDKYEADVAFYNFQIWSNSLDDLLLLGEEVVRLLEVQKPILEYHNSAPPSVFVRKGNYHNGKLDLQIINTNGSKTITFDGGLRSTETNSVEKVSSTLDLEGNYITNMEIDAGNLFDIGFRIGDGIATPDDLFMSDGPWGYDDAAPSLIVDSYKVTPNNAQFNEDEFPIERNIELVANTSEYMAAYRALTPKFNPLDFTAYNSLKLKAKGTGTMIIKLMKESVSNWESQYKARIALTPNLQDYSIQFSDFSSISGIDFEPNDITSIVFTMLVETGDIETKKMTLQQLCFSTSNSLSNALTSDSLNTVAVSPNPMGASTTLHFTSQNTETVTLMVYNQLGSLVKTITHEASLGANEIKLNRGTLSSGLYFCKVQSDTKLYKITKLILE